MAKFNRYQMEVIIRDYFKDFLTEMEFNELGGCLLMRGQRNGHIIEHAFNISDWENYYVGFEYHALENLKGRIMRTEATIL